jgi:hypothetical protein
MPSKYIKRYIGIVVSIIAIGYFIFFLQKNVSNLPELNWNFYTFFALTVSVLMYTLGTVSAGIAWSTLLSSYGLKIKLIDILIVYSKAQFAKYIPGNIGHHIGRVYLAREIGIPVHIAIQTMLLESVWVISLGGLLSTLSLLFFSENLLDSNVFGLKVEWVALFAIVSFFSPILLLNIMNKYFPDTIEKITGSNKLHIPSWVSLIKVVFLLFLCFFIVGLILDLLSNVLFTASGGGVFFLVCAYAFSWIVGYFVPGAPAGLGVREVALTSILSPIYGPGTAISISLLLRVVTVLGDGLIFGAAVLASKSK